MSIVSELRNKTSRDNRALLDRAANEIERLQCEIEALKTQLNFANGQKTKQKEKENV